MSEEKRADRLNRDTIRRREVVDPNPITLPVKFQRPPTLAEQVARYIGAHERYAASQGHETPEEAEDFGDDDEDEPQSPHELVFDPLLNRELPRYEKVLLDRDREKFEMALHAKVRRDQEAAATARRMKQATEAERKLTKDDSRIPSEPEDDQ